MASEYSHSTGKYLENVLKCPRRINRLPKGYYQSQGNVGVRGLLEWGLGQPGLLQGCVLCEAQEITHHAAFKKGSSEELVSLAGSIGQGRPPWQQQGQSTTLRLGTGMGQKDTGPQQSQFSAKHRAAPQCF